MPGAKRLIEHLEKHGIPMVICTGSSDPSYDNKVKNKPEILELFGKMQYILRVQSAPGLFLRFLYVHPLVEKMATEIEWLHS